MGYESDLRSLKMDPTVPGGDAEPPVYTPSKWQREYHLLRTDYALGAGSAGPGKAQSFHTLTPTVAGLVEFGNIKVGDRLYDKDGMPCSVVGVSQDWVGLDCYRVYFDDGTTVDCCGQHEWLCQSYLERKAMLRKDAKYPSSKWEPRIRTTEYIFHNLKHGPKTNFTVDNCGPLQNPHADLPIPPYTLGAWLGNGRARGDSITQHYPDVLEEIKKDGFDVTQHNYDYLEHGILGLYRKIKDAGLQHNKCIPEIYQAASEEQRWALLQGFVDTDGHVRKDQGVVEIVQCREHLIHQFYRLVCSLGLKPTMGETPSVSHGKVVGKLWRLKFSPRGLPCARVPRKATLLGQMDRTTRWRYIVNVEPIPSEPMHCIEVDSPSHTYLTTAAHIPTHNSVCLKWDPWNIIRSEHQRCADPTHPGHMRWGASTAVILFLRRTSKMLDQIISQCQAEFPRADPSVRWNGSQLSFAFASGARYQFSHCNNKIDYINFMSKQFSEVLFDELTQFDCEQYEEISTRVRTSDPWLEPLLKVRAMSNPVIGSDEMMKGIKVKDPAWVRKMFVDPAPQGRVVLAKKIRLKDGTEKIKTRIYLPAKLSDNPDPLFVQQYEAQLQDKPEHIRKALLDGDWYHVPDSFFGQAWNASVHVCKPFAIPSTWRRFRSMDWGLKTYGVVLWWALDDDGNAWVEREFTFKGMAPEKVAFEIKTWEKSAGIMHEPVRTGKSPLTGPADTQLWEKRDSMTVLSKADQFAREGVRWLPAAKKSRRQNANLLLDRLRDVKDGVAGITFFENCRNCITSIPIIPTDPETREDPADIAEDHWLDATLYGVAYISKSVKGKTTRDIVESDIIDKNKSTPRGRFGYYGG